ncbi:MAG: alkaline phosphatase PhoX [Acidobacteriota bacterium]
MSANHNSDKPSEIPTIDLPSAATPGAATSRAATSGAEPATLPVDRRRFLKYVGAGAAALFSSTSIGTLLQGCAASGGSGWVGAKGVPVWTSPPYPVPLPGDPASAKGDAERLASYRVEDDVVLPAGFRYDVLAQWGDVFGAPGHEIHFGYNNDYTGLVPIPGSEGEYWLMVNHEYVCARPWLEAHEEVFGGPPPNLSLTPDPREVPIHRRGIFTFDGFAFDSHPLLSGNAVDLANADAVAQLPETVRGSMRTLAERMLGDVGISVLRVRRTAAGGFEVVQGAVDHRRVTAYGRENVAGAPEEHSRFTGPAAYLFDTPPRGTMSNCSGGTTPWGTFLTCEENFHNEAVEAVDPSGRPIEGWAYYYGGRGDRINGVYVFDELLPSSVVGGGLTLENPLDGREFGWVTEIDPATGHLSKHTGLGRFRHENVTLRCEAGKRLAAYMGDDRRGGHVWKFVSDAVVEDPTDKANSRLLEQGTLYVARFREDFTGEWIPLAASTPLRAPEPDECFSQHVKVPSRFVGGPVAVGDTDRDYPEIELEQWQDIIESFTGKPFAESTLADLVRPEAAEGADPASRADGILAMDAFLMANACGGTPLARPEDLEVHPLDGSVYIAFTDATLSSDGSPDRRIFPDSSLETSRQYGAIYRIMEGGVETAESDPAATDFTWGKFVSSGEVADNGGGFACADNMVFDPQANLWMVTDITTTVHNFPTSRVMVDGTNPGGRNFPGVFGNNAMFMIPTRGPNVGVPHLFAMAPMEAEFCGPTFTDDGETLILAVQHPGEGSGTRRSDHPEEVQTHVVHDRDDQPFDQERTVPVGSNFPHGELDRAPRPCVVCITREA